MADYRRDEAIIRRIIDHFSSLIHDVYTILAAKSTWKSRTLSLRKVILLSFGKKKTFKYSTFSSYGGFTMDYRTQITEFIINNFLLGDQNRLKNDTSFLDSGIIDSTGILEVITFLEQTFGVKVNDDELLPENLDSVDNIVGFIASKKKV